MKSYFTAVLFVAALAVPSLALASDTERRTISVTGQGETSVVADIATVSVGVRINGEDRSEVMDEASTVVQTLIATIEAAAIPPADYQTGSLYLSPRYGEDSRGGTDFRSIVGYEAANTLTVKVRDLTALGGLLSDMIAGGANSINGVEFGYSEPKDALNDARRAAVTDAMEKAALFAEASGVTLGELLQLNEGGSNGGAGRFMAEAMMRSVSVDVPVAPGEITMSATVSMVFAID